MNFLDQIAAVLNKHNVCIKDVPDKLLHLRFPATQSERCFWEFFVNGNAEPKEVEAEQWGKIELQPYDFAIFWNGWLAGLINPAGGQMAAHKEGANPKTFLAALKSHLEGRSA